LKRFAKARKDLLVAVNETVTLLYLYCVDFLHHLLIISDTKLHHNYDFPKDP
jgi:hypothetical protein